MIDTIIISRGPVGPDFNGGSMTVWGFMTGLIKNYNLNPHLIIFFENTKKDSFEVNLTKKYLNQINVDYKFFFINSKNSYFSVIINLFKFNYSFFFNTFKIKKDVSNYIFRIKPSKIYTYHFDSLTLIPEEFKRITVALLGDKMHEPRIYRRKILNKNFFKRLILDTIDNLYFKIVETKLFNNLEKIFYFAHYYTINNQNKRISYIRTMLEDQFNHNQINKIIHDKYSKKNNLDILMIGGLHGTVTISGLIFLNNFLKKNAEIDGITFNLIGKGNLINKVIDLSNNKLVNFLGRIENFDEYLSKKKIILVPNTIILGIRVRIITSLMHGLVVITHLSNLSGIPELIHKDNCLIFEKDEEFLDILNDIKNNRIDLLKISLNARKLFIKSFNNFRVIDEFENKLFN